MLASGWVRDRAEARGRPAVARLGLAAERRTLTEAWQGFTSLGDAESRRAFLATTPVRHRPGRPDRHRARPPADAVGPFRTLVVWGTHDRMIPAWHATTAQQAIAGSRVELFEGAGHFPHLEQPERFARLLGDLMAG